MNTEGPKSVIICTETGEVFEPIQTPAGRSMCLIGVASAGALDVVRFVTKLASQGDSAEMLNEATRLGITAYAGPSRS